MAELFWDKDCSTRDREEIQSILKKLDVQLSYWAVADGADAQDLLGQDILSDDQKEQLLEYHDHYFSRLRNEQGYQSRDLIVLHKNLEGLDGLLQKFNRCHTHDDDEVRYIIDGSGIFGFVLPNGEQVKLKVEAGEFINVPKDTEHWFHLDPSRRIKAVRYFTGKDGWVPVYTETEARF